MTDAGDALVIRPKRLRQAFFVYDGDTPAETRRRWRQAAPAVAVPLLGIGYGIVQGTREHGSLFPLFSVVAIVGGIVAIAVVATMAERPRALHVTADELVVERWRGRRRHPRPTLERAETTRVMVGRVVDEHTTFVLGPPRRRLVRLLGPRRRAVLTLSRQQWQAADIEALLDRLALPHVVHEGEVLLLAEVRRRYRGAFSLLKRRPFLAGILITVGLLAAILAIGWALAVQT